LVTVARAVSPPGGSTSSVTEIGRSPHGCSRVTGQTSRTVRPVMPEVAEPGPAGTGAGGGCAGSGWAATDGDAGGVAVAALGAAVPRRSRGRWAHPVRASVAASATPIHLHTPRRYAARPRGDSPS